MINIKVNEKVQTQRMYNPADMLLNTWPEGQIFQQYFNGVPQKDYYINCGLNEPSVIHLWYNEEEKHYCISTNDKKSLLGFNHTVIVSPIDAEVLITLEKK